MKLCHWGKPLLLMGLFLFACAPAYSVTPGKMTGGLKSTHPAWFKESFLDIASDSEEASDRGKHLILFMHLNNCPYCYKMLEENFAHAPYTPYIKENFDVIVINIKGDRDVEFNESTSVSEKDLAKLLKVSYTPTILFLNKENKTVLRVNGYRSVPAFRHALNYVQQKAYLKTSLNQFIEQQQPQVVYQFKSHPQFKLISNLQSVSDKPLAVLIEDQFCDACNDLYSGHLSNPETNELLKKFTVVRLNARSNDSLIDPAGNKTTVKAFVESLDLSYRPGFVLFDKGKEIRRIDALLYTYHFQETLRYVGERHYVQYPKNFYNYLGKRTEMLLKSGKNIDLSK